MLKQKVRNLQAGVGTWCYFCCSGAMEGDFLLVLLLVLCLVVSVLFLVLLLVVLIGIGGSLAAADMATGASPFCCRWYYYTKPTHGLVGEAGKEGVFPLEGKRGRDTFLMMGEGILEAQKKAKMEFADLQSLGLKRVF